jgi:protein ImuB
VLILFAPAERNRTCVVACTVSARRYGVVPGMLLAEAQALCPSSVQFEPHDPAADHDALRELARWAGQFSPCAGIDAPDGLRLDVTGCGYGYGGEEGLALAVVASLRQQGYWATAAIADTAGAAWAIARFAPAFHPFPRDDDARTCLVPRGEHPAALRPLPVESLRLSADVVDLLHQFDVRRVDQLLALRRADLPSRFGPELLLRVDQALGLAEEVLTPERAPDVAEASWTFEPAIADGQILDTVIRHLLENIIEQLWPRQLGVQRLLCSLELVAAEPMHFPVALLKPSLSLRHLAELVRLHVERLSVPAEIAAVSVRAVVVAPLEFHQGQMFDDDVVHRERQTAALVERLSSRLGETSVLRPRLLPDPQPELACSYEPCSNAERGTRNAERKNGSQFRVPSSAFRVALRPPWLKPEPVLVEVMSVVPDGPPIRFRWGGRLHDVAHCWGPERIETGWWRGDDVRRDYYLIETTAGECFWLFRTLPEERWFFQAMF